MTPTNKQPRKAGVVAAPKIKVYYNQADNGDLLVRLDEDDRDQLQAFYRWLAMRGLNVIVAKAEFGAMDRVRVPARLGKKLRQSFELREASEVL